MMSRLAAKDSNERRPFKPQIYKNRGSYPQGQNRSYNQRGYQNRGRLGNRPDSRNRGQYGNNGPRFQKNYRDNNFQENTRGYGRQIVEENTGIIGAMIIFPRNYGNNRDRSSSNSISRSGSRASTNRDMIRC